MLHLEQKNALLSAVFTSMTTDYILMCYGLVKMDGIGSHDSSNMYIEEGDGNVKGFAGFAELLSGKTAA